MKKFDLAEVIRLSPNLTASELEQLLKLDAQQRASELLDNKRFLEDPKITATEYDEQIQDYYKKMQSERLFAIDIKMNEKLRREDNWNRLFNVPSSGAVDYTEPKSEEMKIEVAPEPGRRKLRFD